MNNGVGMTDNKELYATLARINAALAAQKAEREQWVADYDRKQALKNAR